MINIPTALYSNKILTYIDSLIEGETKLDFYSLDETEQDHLVALGLEALNYDVEIILNSEANSILPKLLTLPDNMEEGSLLCRLFVKEKEYDLIKEIKNSAREYFSYWFDGLIDEQIEERNNAIREEHGARKYIDPVTGELTWI